MTEPPSWQPPTGGTPPPPPPPAYGPPGTLPQYGAPQYGAPPGYGTPSYGTPGYGNPTYQGYPPYQMQAPKPGIIPLRPLAVGEILDGAFATIRRHPRAVLGLAAAVACVQQALTLLARVATGTLTQNVSLTNGGNGSNVGAAYTSIAAGALVTAVAATLLTGMLCLIVSDSILGQPTSARSAWTRLRPLTWRLIGVTLVATLLEYIGAALCLAPGIWLWGIWAIVVPALVLERTTFRGAFSRSRALVKGSFWRVWGVRALGSLIAGFLNGLVGFVAGLSTLRDIFAHPDGTTVLHISTTTIVLTAVLTIVATTLTAPFISGVITLLYVDRRIRVEALDVQLQQAAAAAPAATTFG